MTSTPFTPETLAERWQHIATAPKDGSIFLICYDDGTVRTGRFLDNSQTQWPWSGFRSMYGAYLPSRKITHWQPLPDPPEAT